MPAELRLTVCQNLAREVRAILERKNLADTPLELVPARCHLAGAQRPVAQATAAGATAGPPRLPLIGCHLCGPGHATNRPPGAQCFDFLIGREFAAALQRQGKYLLSPGWLERWQEYLSYWGFDQPTAQRFFAESMLRLTLLDTGINPRSGDQLRAFSTYVGLPAESLPVGLDHLRLELERRVDEWRRGEQQARAQTAAADGQRRLGDYAMVYDLMGRLTSARTETEAVAAIFELFTMLVAPARLFFLPVVDGKAGSLVTHPPAEVGDDRVKTRLLALPGECAWREPERGFDLRIGAGGDTVAVMAVEGIALPQHGPHYLSLAVSLSQVCSLAIRNARNYDQLKANIGELERLITQRKRDEAALQQLLREKEALLKEVHHRVKNNLQLITSMLRMEAHKSGVPETKGVLKEMQARIRSVALLHELLYKTGNYSRVKLADYLRQIATHFFQAQNAAPGTVRLVLELTAAEVVTKQAIPCALLLNELLSNSLKHGFPAGHAGEVRVELHPVGDGPQLRLRVSDTGVGLAADFSTRRTGSLGLQLVTDLARQIGGRLEIGPGPAAIFEVIFIPNQSGPNPSVPPP